MPSPSWHHQHGLLLMLLSPWALAPREPETPRESISSRHTGLGQPQNHDHAMAIMTMMSWPSCNHHQPMTAMAPSCHHDHGTMIHHHGSSILTSGNHQHAITTMASSSCCSFHGHWHPEWQRHPERASASASGTQAWASHRTMIMPWPS